MSFVDVINAVSKSVESGDGWSVLYRAELHLTQRGGEEWWSLVDGEVVRGSLQVLFEARMTVRE